MQTTHGLRSVIQVHPTRREWFTAPREWQSEIATTPVVEITRDGRLGVHRTHLAVLAQQHPEARQMLDQLVRVRDWAAFDAGTEPLGWKLRGYQHVGRDFILNRRGTLLADAMRIGKTLTTVASHEPESGPLVVVGPLAARAVWLKEIQRRWPGQETVVLRGRKYDPSVLEGPKSIFVHYDILQGWQSFGTRLRIGTLVFDEAHNLSNPKTRRTQAAFLLSARAERVVAVTGTPLWNKPTGIWAILACIVPGAFGKFHDFGYRYAAPVNTAYGMVYTGSSNEEEFQLRMREVMIRRRWEDVRSDLPAVERSVETVDITEKQAYDLEVTVERLRQAGDKPTRVGEIARLRRLLAQIKLDSAVDAACRVLDSGEPVVVWAWHKDVAHRIAEKIAEQEHEAHCITGDSGIDTREQTIARWRAGPPAALVATIPVGQVAIDLSHARQAIYAEVDWTPAMIAQSEMRVFSPDRPMAITYIVADHEVDRGLVEALQTKCATALAIGVPAADTTVEVIANAFGVKTSDAGNLQRLMDALLSGPEYDPDEADWRPSSDDEDSL